jgi:AraC-like DNA-binding protein
MRSDFMNKSNPDFIDTTKNKDYFEERMHEINSMEQDSREQLLLQRMRIAIYAFLETPCSFEKLSEITGIPKATINRYFNDEVRLQKHFMQEYLRIKPLLNRPLTDAERDIRLSSIVRYYIKFGGSIEEISARLGYSSSTIQRDLNDEERIIRLFSTDINNIIKENLKEASEAARITGGTNFSNNNTTLKDDSGRFIGSVRVR